MADLIAAVSVLVIALAALVSIARENRYRFVDRKLTLYTELTQSAEARHDVIHWQLEDQGSAAARGHLAKVARIRSVPPGEPLDRARSAIRLATRSKVVDDAAEALRVAASDLGQVAYIAPADDVVVPSPDRAAWDRLEAAYSAAWSTFIAVAKDDVETTLTVWRSPW